MWLAEHCRISESAAYAQVRLARELPALHFTAQVFERGEISAQHAAVVARIVEMVRRAEGDTVHAEDLMVQEARERDPRDLLRWGLSLVHRLAPREVEDLEERRIERRYLRTTEAFEGGLDIQGYLDPERGLRLKTAIDRALGPRQKDDHRSPSQRQVNGLDQVVTGCWTQAGCRHAGASDLTSRLRRAWTRCLPTPALRPPGWTGAASRSRAGRCAGSPPTPRSRPS
jgi:hypothetical protein